MKDWYWKCNGSALGDVLQYHSVYSISNPFGTGCIILKNEKDMKELMCKQCRDYVEKVIE